MTKHKTNFPHKSYKKIKQKIFTTCLIMGCKIHTSQGNQACIDQFMFELLPRLIASLMGVITLMVENQNKE